MFKYISRLIDKNDPALAHIAITIFGSVIIALICIVLTFASIFSKKNLLGELSLSLATFGGLIGWNTKQNIINNNKQE